MISALGLLVNVPWAIVRLFPGENRAPIVVLVTGTLLVVLAVVLTRRLDAGRRTTRGGHLPSGRSVTTDPAVPTGPTD